MHDCGETTHFWGDELGKKSLVLYPKINLCENCGKRHFGMRSVWVLIWTARQDVKEGE